MLPLLFLIPVSVPPAPFQEAVEIVEVSDVAQEKFDALKAEYDQAMRDFWNEYGKKSEEERQAFLEQRPDAETFVPRFMALAEEYMGTTAAANCYAWIAQYSQNDASVDEALAVLIEDHVDDEALAPVCRQMERRYADGEAFLMRVIEESSNPVVKGAACYSLGKLYMNQVDMANRLSAGTAEDRASYEEFYGKDVVAALLEADPAAIEKKAAECLERVCAEYPEGEHWRGSLGKAAEGDLFQLRKLAIGMPAPDIEGEDIDGVAFKLSDYKGQVVVLDFWGHW